MLLPNAPNLIPWASANVLSLENFNKGLDTDEWIGLYISIYAPGPGTVYLFLVLLKSLVSLELKGTCTASSVKILVLISSFFFSKLYFPGPGFYNVVGFV